MVHITEDTPQDHKGSIDLSLKATIKELKKEMNANNDDGIAFFAGDTGTGKSTLVQHIITEYAGVETYDKDHTTFSLEQYADKLQELSEIAHERIVAGKKPIGLYVAGDEFDMQAIENQSKKNRGADKIFNVIRLYQILQCLCWPQLEKIPRAFLKDRVKLVFILDSKEISNRTYILYTKENIRKMFMDGIESFDITTLTNRKNVEKYASLVGWFRPNKNIDDQNYVIAKSEAILNRVRDWNKALKGEDDTESSQAHRKVPASMNLNQAANHLGVSNVKDLQKELFRLAKLDKVNLGQVYRQGRWYLTEEVIDLVAKEGGCVRV